MTLPRALAHGDWTLHAYALMSNLVHLALLAGDEPLWRWSTSLHISVAKWLNRTQGRFGPVFAERAISGPAASALLRDTQPLHPLAREIAAELRRQSFLLS